MQPYMGYAIISFICIGLLYLVYTNKTRAYPYFLYGAGLGMLLLTTLAGPYLVGSDIHMEYFFAQYYGHSGTTGPILFEVPQGTSIANNIIAAYFPWDPIWTYKIFFPVVFALVPVMIYLIARRWLSAKAALLAGFAFIAFTPFFMEIPTIARQMFAEIFFVEGLLVLVCLQTRWKYILIFLAGVMLPLGHYSIAVVAALIIGVALVMSLILRAKYRLGLSIFLLGILITSAIYFPLAQDGAVLRKLGHLYNNYAPIEWRLTNPIFELQDIPTDAIPSEPDARVNIPDQDKPDPDLPVLAEIKNIPFLERYDTITEIALGGDFLEANWLGKVYRISQWSFLILIFPGLFLLRREKLFWALIPGFGLIIVMCIIPGWANILNMTRFIHIGLILLCIPIARAIPSKYLVVGLVLYFVVSSGLLFEATQQPNIQELTAPYNVGLSNYRMDLGASCTSDDMAVRDYIFENELYPINSDIYGAYLMIERIGPVGPRADLNIQLPKTPRPLEGYIFVRSRNSIDGTFVIWRNIGLRIYWPIEDWSVTQESEVIFQSGDAKVVKVGSIETRFEPSR